MREMQMDLSISEQEKSGYLDCTITGKWVTDDLKQYTDTIRAELARLGHKRLLVDMATVVGPPPEMDRFHMGEYIASALRGIKVAIVYKKVYENDFFEDTAVNRGAYLTVFPDKETALTWLMKD